MATTLNNVSSASAIVIEHEGRTWQFSPLTFGVRARFNDWLRRRFIEQQRLLAELQPERRERLLAEAEAALRRGQADFGYCPPEDRGRRPDDPARQPTFAGEQLHTFEAQVELVRLLLQRHHPEIIADDAAELMLSVPDAVVSALGRVLNPNRPTPAAASR